MATPSSTAVIWSQYAAARLCDTALASFPVEANLRTARALGRLIHAVDGRHRERTARHLRLAFPEWSEQRVAQVTRASFEHLVQLAIEVLASPRLIGDSNWSHYVRVGDLGPALERLNAGKPSLLITGHLGNWEVLGGYLSVLGYEIDAIARPLDNPLINRWLLSIRERRGMRVITKFNATEQMLGALAAGRTLGFIADQNAGDGGMFVPFFGRLASTYKSIGLLAIRERVPIACGFAHRRGLGFGFELGVDDVIKPEEWEGQPDPLYYVTARYMRSIENMIRRRPEQYLWMHRRWKSRPRWERQGKPMPASIRRKLEALPWMDEQTVDRVSLPVE